MVVVINMQTLHVLLPSGSTRGSITPASVPNRLGDPKNLARAPKADEAQKI
jgi:hypothetical protein